MSHEQLMVVYQHHERIDGSGYPVGFQGDEIHPWARMLAIVDVFDAITGRRPYRKSAASSEAMEYICSNAGTHFDPEMVACWKSIMDKN
jgi:HD-GYP domain-containing protein (c-di-GMP phosphodiesterase class II)